MKASSSTVSPTATHHNFQQGIFFLPNREELCGGNSHRVQGSFFCTLPSIPATACGVQLNWVHYSMGSQEAEGERMRLDPRSGKIGFQNMC